MQRGTIVLVSFPFTNLKSSKVRPALIVSSESIDKRDVIVAFISSVINKASIKEVDFILEKTNKGFPETGLKKDSIIKLGKLTTLEKNIILGELGYLSKEMMKIVDEKLKIVLGLK